MKNKIIVALFLILVFAFTALDLITPDREFSEWENRDLAKSPKITLKTFFSGDFGSDYEKYMTDQFTLRDTFVKVKFLSDKALRKTDAGGIYLTDNALYAIQNEVDKVTVDKNIKAIESFRENTGLPTSLLIVPSSTYIERENLPLFANVIDEKEIFDKVKFDGFINVVDAFEKGENLYFKTDHHWNEKGALLAYNAYRKDELTREDFDITTVSEEFLGTSVSKSGAVGLEPDTLERWERGKVTSVEVYDGKKVEEYKSIYFEEYLEKKDKYSYYLGQNQPIVRIKTESDGGKILIFKDSYAHNFSQLLVGDYSEIVLVDLRYLKLKTELLLEQNFSLNYSDFDEALFLYSFDTFTTQYNMLWL